MKTVTMDWPTYMQEQRGWHKQGFRAGIAQARQIVLEILSGCTIENAPAEIIEEQILIDLFQDLKPRIDARINAEKLRNI